MAFPEMHEPFDDPEPGEEARRPAAPLPPAEKPDWLTHAGDIFEQEARSADEESPEAPPGKPAPVRPLVMTPGPKKAPTPEPAAAAPEAPRAEPWDPTRPLPSWSSAPSSVPTLRAVLPPAPAGPDREERDARVPHPAYTPPAVLPLPGADEDLRAVPAAAPTLAPLREPWWLIALESLKGDRRVQAGAAGAALAVILLLAWMWPRGVGTTPLSSVRRHPESFDGRTVVVRGRVGDDVFPVGGGYAFYLMQGRDTIVTFTRSRVPTPHEVVTVSGSINTGFLDGRARQALFEDPSSTSKK